MELISNGFLYSGELDPWQPCGGMELEGGVTDENPVFLSDYNLQLRGDDCVRQQLPYPASVDEGGLSLWLSVRHIDNWPGSMSARVTYDDGDHSAFTVTHDVLLDREHICNPYHLRLAVDPDRHVTAVQLRCHEAPVPWYICAVSMEGNFVFPYALPPAHMSLADRLRRAEKRLAHLERATINALADLPRPKPKRKAAAETRSDAGRR